MSVVTMRRRVTSAMSAVALAGAALTLPVVMAPAVSAAPAPVADRTATMVTADALPTTQIDGVAWSQVILGNRVFVGGDFTTARPYGAAPGVGTVPRTNLLAYTLSTGVLDPTFAPVLNGQVKAVALSPDGSRLYIGGDFTTVNGQPRSRIAAFDTTSGDLIANFAPSMNHIVNSLVVTTTTVYAGGDFTQVNGLWRIRLAAIRTSDGALTSWAPQADLAVWSMALTPDTSKLIVAGAFVNMNGSVANGSAALDPVNGTSLPWAASAAIVVGGTSSAMTSVTTDGSAMYVTAYTYGGTHNFEGMASLDPATGSIIWLEDCHGDSYSSYSDGKVAYVVGHAHYCLNVGGFNQLSSEWQRTLAFTHNATGTLLTNKQSGYKDWAGTPSPTMLNWFPTLQSGTFTGQSQAAWTVTGNGEYVIQGGEFPAVNNNPQQGLVRFAVPAKAPNKQGPRLSGADFLPTAATAVGQGTRVTIGANWDRDDSDLTYSLIRDGDTAHPIGTKVVTSQFWNLPVVTLADPGHDLAPSSTHSYAVAVKDRDGNTVVSDPISMTTNAAASPYAQLVLADQPTGFWRLDEASGKTLYDWAGSADAATSTGLTRGTVGAIAGDSDRATTFSGSSTGYGAAPASAVGANDPLTLEAWVKTTSSSGGAILALGNAATGTSTVTDRVLYMDNSGRILFGVNNGTPQAISSVSTYRDGVWHHVVATLGGDGSSLYVDGIRVARNSALNSASASAGYWRIGGDNLTGWPNKPTSNYLSAGIDEAAVYPRTLTAQQIAAHAVAGGKSIPAAPTDPYAAAVFNDGAETYWRLGETSGTVAADSGIFANKPGTYRGGFTLNQPGAIANSADKAVKLNGSNAFVSSQGAVINPVNFSAEAWFKTTSTAGGEIIGFGNSQTGTSTSYDREVFASNDGRLNFLVGTAKLVTPKPYNDGAWHHVVASSDSTGRNVYVDGALVVAGSAMTPLVTTGYWRVGGDSTAGSTSRFLNGTVDEPAIYYSALSPAQVAAHYTLGSGVAPNQAPTARFTSTATALSIAFDGSASTDPDGTVASYSWNWGDGTAAGTGATPTHVYASPGNYQVTLTVTDDKGALGSSTKTIAAAANQLPTAAFTSVRNGLTITVDGSSSADPDGSVAAYLWNWGDNSTAGSGATASHAYAAAGTYAVSLTVTDNWGGSATTTQSITVAPNQAPVAAFTSQASDLVVAVDGTQSVDADGTVASYDWNWGDNSPNSAGATASHTYAQSGTYSITLTVTDNQQATGTVTHDVTVLAANQLPNAAFTPTITNLSLAVDASASTDPDGSISTYSWNWGDNTPADSGVSATHVYSAAGTYQVTLTVTDDRGGSASRSTPVTAVLPTTVVGTDTFGRTVSNGWGSADTGGAWTLSGTASRFAVAGGRGSMSLSTAGAALAAYLNGISVKDVDLVSNVSFDKTLAGAAVYVAQDVRRISTSNYRIKARLDPNGSVQLSTVRVVGGVETTLKTVTVAGLTYTQSTVLRMRVQTTTDATGTTLSGRIWAVGASEPAVAQVSSVDTTAALQASGGVGLWTYLGSTATNAPLTASFDNVGVISSDR
ncbi:PKD repeat-containing protein [Nakamurella panacisegetis]|uniref:PKD repeat-containing protein n=1 Tax=Nakamurella panacisegetis TaxID=1090615 RepID=A0A1H0IIS4_9ACTN|nr:LamG domain-containing protein [Nakamurella panacisegetis]SDO31354.1 PKD repeat-containing protein [Nakamurella panacisegetis]